MVTLSPEEEAQIVKDAIGTKIQNQMTLSTDIKKAAIDAAGNAIGFAVGGLLVGLILGSVKKR